MTGGSVFSAKLFGELTAAELYEILKSRSEIFIIEQHIMYLDMDDTDYNSLHCFITEGGRVTAYLRAYYEKNKENRVKIGRVLTLEHGRGNGKALLTQSVEAIKRRMDCRVICMDAQKSAVGFYEKMGFKVVSGEFLEAGLPHVAMSMEL